MRKKDFLMAGAAQRPKVSIGDRVRFLNDVGAGIVTAFQGKDKVLVEDENGFDFPVFIAECVVVEEASGSAGCDGADALSVSSKRAGAPEQTGLPDGVPAVMTKRAGAPEQTGLPDGCLNVSLAFLPVETGRFMQSDFEVYFVNESSYSMYFCWMCCRDDGWVCREHGLVEADTKVFVGIVGRQEVNDLARVCVQVLAFKEGACFALKDTVSVEVRVDPVKFCRRKCFAVNDYFDEDAMIVSVVREDAAAWEMRISAEAVREAVCERRKGERREAAAVAGRSKPVDAVVEVDLHINQLVDTTAGMDSAAIREYQVSRFHEVMRSHLGEKGRRIVFIHGKGEGVLRAALEKELKTVYGRRSRFQDASFREYGFGATMVVMI
jgi:hypothetical protein